MIPAVWSEVATSQLKHMYLFGDDLRDTRAGAEERARSRVVQAYGTLDVRCPNYPVVAEVHAGDVRWAWAVVHRRNVRRIWERGVS